MQALSLLLLLFIIIVVFTIVFAIFVIYNRVQSQVLRDLLTPFGPGTILLFNVLVLHYRLSLLYYLLLINRVYFNICK